MAENEPFFGNPTPPANPETPPTNPETPPTNPETPPANPETPTANPETPPEIQLEDYEKIAKLSEEIDPKGENQVDVEALKAVAPTLKECGVSPENANKLINALAKYQLDRARDAHEKRMADNTKAKALAAATFTKNDLATINRAIDAKFKPGGIMNYIIRYSELGNDLEFLALMKEIGERLPSNESLGGANGGTGTTGQSAGFEGIAAAWN